MNAKLPCKTKALPPPLCPAFVIYLSVAHCSPEKKERDRESENKRANKVKVNPLVYCSYSLYSSACNYYWKINIFFIPVERNYCYKIKKTALPLALTIYIYLYTSLSFQFLSSLILSPLLLSSFAGPSWESFSAIFSALLISFVLPFSILCTNPDICFSRPQFRAKSFFLLTISLTHIYLLSLFVSILHNFEKKGKNFPFKNPAAHLIHR